MHRRNRRRFKARWESGAGDGTLGTANGQERPRGAFSGNVKAIGEKFVDKIGTKIYNAKTM